MSRLHWAITPEAMEGLKLAVECGLKGEDREAFHKNSAEEYEVYATALGDLVEGSKLARIKGSVGSLFIAGPLVPRASLLAESSGVVSVDRLSSEFRMLEKDASVKDILLVFDSPGGAVTGISEFASIIAGCDKKVTAYVTGMAASAAYWLASSADNIVSSATGLTGSIGTIFTINMSKEEGTFEIVSTQSPDKRPDAATKEGRAVYQTVADDLASVFVSAVAKGRGTTQEKVLSDFGKGASLVAFKALEAGMIDKIDTLENTLSALANVGASTNFLTARSVETKEKKNMLTLQDVLAEHPHLAGEVAKIKMDAMTAGKEEAQAQVQARIDGAMPFALDSNYHDVIRKMAMEVVAGKQELSSLIGAVAAFDAMKAINVQADAQADSDDQPPAAPLATDTQSPENDGVLRTSADIDAELRDMRGE
jgi:ClpP class serine protease